MIDPGHLVEYVIVPALDHIEADGIAARRLVLGTALTESSLTYLNQHNGGPALGLWQMEPATHTDHWSNFLKYRNALQQRVRQLTMRGIDLEDQLRHNLMYAAAMCRVHYLRDSQPLPAADDLEGLASMWKRVYNSRKGKGKPADFLEHSLTIVDATDG